jgi:hypothetical protein
MNDVLTATPASLVWAAITGEPPVTLGDALALLDFALGALHELSLP